MDTGTIVYSRQVRFDCEDAAVGTYALMERVDDIYGGGRRLRIQRKLRLNEGKRSIQILVEVYLHRALRQRGRSDGVVVEPFACRFCKTFYCVVS